MLLRTALNKIPQLAFGLIVDKWRWGVMKGSIPPAMYNHAWWALHAEYLGVVPPIARTEEDFDAAAKSHIVDNTPYIRQVDLRLPRTEEEYDAAKSHIVENTPYTRQVGSRLPRSLPITKTEEDFGAAAKSHIVDNTSYIRQVDSRLSRAEEDYDTAKSHIVENTLYTVG